MELFSISEICSPDLWPWKAQYAAGEALRLEADGEALRLEAEAKKLEEKLEELRAAKRVMIIPAWADRSEGSNNNKYITK